MWLKGSRTFLAEWIKAGKPTQVLDIKVQFFYPENNLLAFTRAVRSAISPFVAGDFYRRPGKLRYRWIVNFASYNLNLSEQDIRKALSTIEACIVQDVNLSRANLPLLKREPNFPTEPRPLPCGCEDPFECKHIKWPTWEQQNAAWKREDHLNAVLRQQTNFHYKPSGHRAKTK